MPHFPFRLGQVYTRQQIHDAVGGGVQSYLPRKNGRIVCGCFTHDLNSHAPDIVLVGDAPNVIRDAEVFAKQLDPVPVFIKLQVNQWEYVGDYVVERYSKDPKELEPMRRQEGRPHAVGALFLKRSG